MNKLQEHQLKIALEIDRICRENNINYLMDAGTLLGAVRHKGFIPWDDDLDICMLREDYDKFAEIAKTELDSKYFYQDVNTDKNYGLCFAKIRENNTIFREEMAKNVHAHEGIFVDIFPIDNISDNISTAKFVFKVSLFLRMLLLAKSKYILDNSTISKKIEIFILKALSIIIPRKFIIYLMKKVQSKYKNKDTKMVTSFGTSYFNKNVMNKKWYSEGKEYIFEGKKLFGTKHYDEFLSFLYGDYMTPPPEGKRENRHGIIEINYNTKKM